MPDYTRLTNLEVTGELKVPEVKIGLTSSTYTATSTDPTAAASTAPTKAEFDAVVTLIKELKTKHNKLVSQLITGSDT
jgi:hypothetical protein